MDHLRLGELTTGIFHAAVEMSLVPIVLADPHQDDCPIVYANSAFSELTGYPVAEIIGRNCRFLQGADTDRAAVRRIREAISVRWNVHEEIVNYRKDGSPFWNALFINPVFNQAGRLTYLFGTQLDNTRRRALEDAMRGSSELLSVAQAGIASAFALPLSEAQRGHLQKAVGAMEEIALDQERLLAKRSGYP